VVFVIVAVVQVPKLMKQLHPKGAGMAAPAPGTVPASSGATAAGAAPAAAASSQLHSFTHLRLKDPFKPLVTVPVASTDSSSSSPSDAANGEATQTTPKPAATPKPKQAKPAAQPAASGTVSFSAAQPPPNAAIVKTNGHRQLIYVGDGFPTADPLFRLVALGDKTVRVGVLGGSFVSGLPTIRLARGKEVTLANEADGSRYVIELVRLTTAEAKPAAAAQPAPTTTAPTSTTPTTTAASSTP